MGTLAFHSRKYWTIGDVTLLLLGLRPPPLPLSMRTFMRLSQLGSSVCVEGSGLFDAPFSASEVRHALTLYSLLKLNFPWWQDALLAFFNLVFSWSVVPTVWKRSIIVLSSREETPHFPTTIVVFLLRRVSSKFSSIWCPEPHVEPHVQILAWHAVTSSLWLVTLRTLAGLWHSSRPSPLSTAFQSPHQQPHRVCATSCPWCAVLFLVLTCSRSVVC